MPKIYKYLEMFIMYFHSREHLPVHVHCKYQGRESKAEIKTENGVIIKITIKTVKGKLPLKESEKKLLREFVEVKGMDILEKWNQFFVLNIPINMETINERV